MYTVKDFSAFVSSLLEGGYLASFNYMEETFASYEEAEKWVMEQHILCCYEVIEYV